MRRVIILLVVGVGLCGAAAGTTAFGLAVVRSQPGTTVVLGSARDPAYPDVVADGSLGFDAVWTDGETDIVTAHRSGITGQWSRPVALSGRVGQAQARVAGSASGAAAAVWYVNTESDQLQSVQASYRPSVTGAWQPAATLARSGADWRSLQVGVDAHGDAFTAWINARGVEMSEHLAGASAWSAPVTVEPDRRAGAGSSLDLALGVSPSGTIALVWERYLGGSTLGGSSGTRDDLLLAVRPAGHGAWLPRVSLGRDGMASGQSDTDPYWYGPQIAINARGTIFVASQWPHAGRYRARAAVIAPGDRWRTPRFVTLPGAGLEPAIAGGAQGYSTVVWEASNSNGLLQAADLSPTARVLDTHRVPGSGSTPRLADDGRGDLVGAWGAAAYRPAGQAWCPRTQLRSASEGYSVAIGPGGVAQVIWDYELGAHGVMRARTLNSCRA